MMHSEHLLGVVGALGALEAFGEYGALGGDVIADVVHFWRSRGFGYNERDPSGDRLDMFLLIGKSMFDVPLGRSVK